MSYTTTTKQLKRKETARSSFKMKGLFGGGILLLLCISMSVSLVSFYILFVSSS